MTPNERALAIRAEAAEFLVKVLLIHMFKQGSDAVDAVKAGEALIKVSRQSLASLTHPLMEPVKSDIFAQQVSGEVERIIGHVVGELVAEAGESDSHGA